ncbi:MAG TPA: PilC/PilY family type IV pilus protein [Patescibacteria group bacterium]|nr:PilC/PilY family type IV pilus protein [Patescibacteria group bacterium]
MSIKKHFFILVILAMIAGPILGQTRLTDDRELFIGVGNASKILPNIMLLADNSGSMNTAIYPIDYKPKIDYTKNIDGTERNLEIDTDLTTTGYTNPNNNDFDLNSYTWNGSSWVVNGERNYVYAQSLKTFNICRGSSQSTVNYDARARFDSLYKSDPSRWKVYKGTITGNFPVIGQHIDYDGPGSGVDDQATIIDIKSISTYWVITVAGYNGSPSHDGYIYINYRLETVLNNNEARFISTGDTCIGFDQTFPNIKLYGTKDADGNRTRYDRNYLYWLAFEAPQTQLDEVKYWATTGFFPDNSGNLVDFGYYRIDVMRRVLADVVREVHMDVNLGIAAFNPASSNEGGYIVENMTNFNTDSAIESMISTKINSLLADTNTPLAETMADIWHYYIGQNPGVLQPHTEANVAADCPIKYNCQKNYVIVMTDGQATYDELGTRADSAPRFLTSYFKVNPVDRNLTNGWGDYDSHDPVSGVQPTDLTKPDGTPYCANYSCWGLDGNSGYRGTDYLDDLAYYMANTDHFPDAVFQPALPDDGSPAWEVYKAKYQGVQTIETYVIGFNTDNDMLAETAKNGNGEYYTASSYDELKEALTNAIVSINLRNFAFAAFTAPKKVSSAVGEGFSFIGYFMPSALSAIWEGHLQSYKMTDRWYVDSDNSGALETSNNTGVNEYENPYYDYQSLCEEANSGFTCLRSLELASIPEWDTRQEIINNTSARNLFTHDSNGNLINFTDAANLSTLQGKFGLLPDVAPSTINQDLAQSIINTISAKVFSDVFHSDIAYIGPPMIGKKYVKNLNPVDCDPADSTNDIDCYERLLRDQGATVGIPDSGRTKVVYVGTNEGILHQVDAKSGKERWGFIPDEVLPSLKKIVVDKEYTFTVDGRLAADDIYYRGTSNSWKTILLFGLRDGGNSFYALDVTTVPVSPVQPTLLWKFVDDEYSGKSWSKPYVGKIRYYNGTAIIDRWVVIVAGGMAFNNEDTDETAGKAVFVIDASTGELIWMIGYKPTGVANPGIADAAGTVEIDTVKDDSVTTGLRYLTAKAEFNYPIPSAITPVDRDSDGYLDSIYFGNVAGHLFKSDISATEPANWKTYQLFKAVTDAYAVQNTVSTVDPATNTVNVASEKDFLVNQNVFGLSSKAMGIIDAVASKKLTVTTISASANFANGEIIVVPILDPIFLSPALAFDLCYNLWVSFGTGDRIRSRTNPDSGKFIALRDGTTVVSGSNVQKTNILLGDLVTLTWTGDVINETNIMVTDKWGWQFTFPMSANHEKLFDPEPLILPDQYLLPHFYFNTYQPSSDVTNEDCAAPKNGLMYFYDLTCNYCGNGTMFGVKESGRIAGGGMFGNEYILPIGTGDVASTPPLQELKPIKLLYTGGLLFWKEKKR